MFRIIRADSDTYITDRVIDEERCTGANVGQAGTLDLFKLYGMSYSGSTPNVELSRALVKFDLSAIQTLSSSGRINTDDSSFRVTLKLFDVYGGQSTPSNFTLAVYPLSQSFDEGTGRDIMYYADRTQSNFLTASWSSNTANLWYMSGANSGGIAGATGIDYITSGPRGSLKCTQSFTTGEEDLEIDVTRIVQSIFDGTVPDHGFRVSYESTLENDNRSYFVKRFASRHAYDQTKRPQLTYQFDDSLISDQSYVQTDVSCTIPLYNNVRGVATDLVSASVSLTGSNCVLLKLRTEISGGWQNYTFYGTRKTQGIYTASVYFSSTDTVVSRKMAESGSVLFEQYWLSTDSSVVYLTGSDITVHPADRGNDPGSYARYCVSTTGLTSEHRGTESVRVRVYITDVQNQYIKIVKTPIETPGLVVRDAHWSIRDTMNDQVIIPFDTTYNSTRMSSDSKSMYFDLDIASLVRGRSYVVDVMLTQDGVDQLYQSVSPTFRVSETL